MEQTLLWHLKTKYQNKYTFTDVHFVYAELECELANLSGVVGFKLNPMKLETNPEDEEMIAEVRLRVEKVIDSFSIERPVENDENSSDPENKNLDKVLQDSDKADQPCQNAKVCHEFNSISL